MKFNLISRTNNTRSDNGLVKDTHAPLMCQFDQQKLQRFRKFFDSYAPHPIVMEVQENPDDIKYAAMLLMDHETRVVSRAAGVLGDLAMTEKCRGKALDVLIEALKGNVLDAKKYSVLQLGVIAEKGLDISIAIPALANALKNNNPFVRSKAALALGNAAHNGADISIAVPALGNMFKDKHDVARANAMYALGYAAKKGTDITAAIPAIIIEALRIDSAATNNAIWALSCSWFPVLREVLTDNKKDIEINRAIVLSRVVAQGDRNKVEAIVNAIMIMMQSKEFKAEVEENSKLYVYLIERIDAIVDAAHKSEEKWAGVKE